jgi:hypothetical protein
MARAHVSLVLGLVVYVSAGSLEAQDEINTDRPDLSGTVVPKGSLQLENGLGWTSDNGRATFDGTESVVRLGLISSGELRVALPDYYGYWVHNASTGFSDILLGWKQQLIGSGSGGFQFSVAPGVSLPTGSHGLTSRGIDPQLGVAWSKSIDSRWSTSGVQYVYYSTENGRHFLQGETVVAIERDLNRTTNVYIEYQGYYGHFGSTNMVELGAAYRRRPNYQWDFLFGAGRDQGAAEVSIGVGFSFRLANMWKRGGETRPDP